MTIEVSLLKDGSLSMISNEPFPAAIRHIEYYKEQKLFQLVFTDPDTEPMLVARELDAEAARIVETAPDMMIVVMTQNGGKPYGYDVPLIQIGV